MDRTRQKMPRNLHLQILRGLAASAVALAHSCIMWNVPHFTPAQVNNFCEFLSTTGVCVFFALSGFVMGRQSLPMFGSWRSSTVFLFRRLVRIAPMYWLGTWLWYRTNPASLPHARQQFLFAMAFLPDPWNPPHYGPQYKVAWTLVLEMFFYVLFALCLLLHRRLGLSVLLGALLFFALNLQIHLLPRDSLSGKFQLFYGTWYLFLFAAGILLAIGETALHRRWPVRSPISPAVAILLPVIVLPLLPFHIWTTPGTLIRYALCIIVVALCAMDRTQPRSQITRGLVLLGDASYCTYLFHLWTLVWISLHLAFRLHHHAWWTLPLVSLILSNLTGLAVHLVVERPLTRLLQNLHLGPQWFSQRFRRPNLGT